MQVPTKSLSSTFPHPVDWIAPHPSLDPRPPLGNPVAVLDVSTPAPTLYPVSVDGPGFVTGPGAQGEGPGGGGLTHGPVPYVPHPSAGPPMALPPGKGIPPAVDQILSSIFTRGFPTGYVPSARLWPFSRLGTWIGHLPPWADVGQSRVQAPQGTRPDVGQ